MPLRARYYTDPACVASWAAEPRRRTLMVEFGTHLAFTYVMGGLARDYEAGFSDPSAGIEAARPYETLLLQWLDRAGRSRMPMDPRLWSEGPIRSTFPACMAVKAASEQGSAATERYLRAVREGLFCFRRKLDVTESLVETAREAGLDSRRFRIDLQSNAIVEAFGSDLEEVRSPPDQARAAGAIKEGQGGERVTLPAVRFTGDGGTAWGFAHDDYRGWRQAALAAGGQPAEEPRPEPMTALRRFGRMATVEVEAVCDLSEQAASQELWRLAAEGRVRPLRILTGTLWEPA